MVFVYISCLVTTLANISMGLSLLILSAGYFFAELGDEDGIRLVGMNWTAAGAVLVLPYFPMFLSYRLLLWQITKVNNTDKPQVHMARGTSFDFYLRDQNMMLMKDQIFIV